MVRGLYWGLQGAAARTVRSGWGHSRRWTSEAIHCLGSAAHPIAAVTGGGQHRPPHHEQTKSLQQRTHSKAHVVTLEEGRVRGRALGRAEVHGDSRRTPGDHSARPLH